MELKDLVGIHVMNGVETGTVKNEGYGWGDPEDCNYVKFRLDATTYMAVEDPSDGYRSCCRELEIVDGKCKTELPEVLVECKMRGNSYTGLYEETNDILEFYDIANGKMFMAVGTANTDDYYPYFVFDYTPEALACNGGENDNGHSMTVGELFTYIDNLPEDIPISRYAQAHIFAIKVAVMISEEKSNKRKAKRKIRNETRAKLKNEEDVQMDNYVMINGKQIPLTDEQIKFLTEKG